MFSRLVVPINRHVTSKSVLGFLNRDFPTLRYKHQSIRTADTVSSGSSPQEKLKIVHGPFRDQPTASALFRRNDPDRFGALNEKVAEPDEIDEGDLAEEEHYATIPLRRNQLPQIRYQHMIEKYIRNRQFKEAIDILEVRMKEDRVKPGYYIYELLIIACGRSGYTKKAFKLYNQMRKRDLEVHSPVYAALFSACAKTIHPNEGLKLATNLRKTMIQNGYPINEIIYNAMIKAFGRCGDIATAFQLVDEMKGKNLSLKIDTMNHLLQVCCSDKEYGFRHALHVWHKIYRRKLTPDVFSFNLMLRCTRDCGIGNIDEMKNVIANILNSSKATLKLKSNKKTNEIHLIEDQPIALANANKDDDSQSLTQTETELDVRQMQPKEVCDQLPNLLSKLPHLGSIVRLSMANTPEDRFQLLGGLTTFIAEMEETKVRPNVKTFAQLLDVIGSTRDAEHELIQKMRYMRVRADTDFFNLLMKRRVSRKDYDGAMQVLSMMEKVDLRPDIVTYCMMAMCCITREQAQQFYQNVEEKGIKLNIEILTALLKNASFAKDYDYVIDVLEYSMSEHIRPSSKFYDLLNSFKYVHSKATKLGSNEEEHAKYDAFFAVYKKWKSQMGLLGLTREEVLNSLNVHPWRQLKEAEGDGIENLKNQRTRRIWKKQHVLKKLTPKELNRLQSKDKNLAENSAKTVEIDEK